VVSALIGLGRLEEAQQLLHDLPVPMTDLDRFLRAHAQATIDLRQGREVCLDSLSSLAAAIGHDDVRLTAEAQCARMGLALAARGDITRNEALMRVSAIRPALHLPVSETMFFWVLDFSGAIIVVALLAAWAAGFPLGNSH